MVLWDEITRHKELQMDRKQVSAWRLCFALFSIFVLMFVAACGGGNNGGQAPAGNTETTAGDNDPDQDAVPDATSFSEGAAQATATVPKIDATPEDPGKANRRCIS